MTLEPEPSAKPSSSYGYCPKCYSKVVARERRLNGNDVCENGHSFPSATGLKAIPAKPSELIRNRTTEIYEQGELTLLGSENQAIIEYLDSQAGFPPTE